MSKNHPRRSFNEVLVDSIDEALASLGETVKTSIYFHLEKVFMIKRQDIPYDVDGFSDALERIFGLGAQHLELLIMKKLHEKVSNEYKWEGPKWLIPDVTFQQYVKLAQLYYEDTGRIGKVEMIVDGQPQEQRI